MMLTLQQIQERAYATAKSKGWHDRPLREPVPTPTGDEKTICPIVHHDRVLAKHALMHTELSEAHECILSGEFDLYEGSGDYKPEGMTVEIADFIIRVGDTTQALGLTLADVPDDWLTKAKGMRPAAEISETAGARQRTLALLWLADVRRHVDEATEAARVDAWSEYTEKLAHAVMYAASIVVGFGGDLGAAIEAKMTYNETRPHRHGGKRA